MPARQPVDDERDLAAAERGMEQAFVKQAQARSLVDLKGHRSVGGIRASIYNAMHAKV